MSPFNTPPVAGSLSIRVRMVSGAAELSDRVMSPVIVRPARSSVMFLSLNYSLLESLMSFVRVSGEIPASMALRSSASVAHPVTVTA